MNSHDILITLLILIIVAIQILVFLSAFRRIKLFREIFPHAQSFRTVKVCIPVERIVDITPEEIFDNLSKYSGNVNEELGSITKTEEDELLPLTVDADWNEEEAVEIWMQKGNKEIKVPVHLVDAYGRKGWVKLVASDDE